MTLVSSIRQSTPALSAILTSTLTEVPGGSLDLDMLLVMDVSRQLTLTLCMFANHLKIKLIIFHIHVVFPL